MAFKLGKESRQYRTFKKPMVFRKTMESGSVAQANMDGTIDVDPSVKVNSEEYKRIVRHEQKHIEDIKTGKAAYGDEWVMWKDKVYFRKEIDGEKVIDGPNGRWPEGHKNHPWEKEAIEAEKQNKN